MIVDTLKNSYQYYHVNSDFRKAFEFLKTVDFENIEPGRYEIDGDRIIANVSEYTTVLESVWESHSYHVDIHYLAKGIEKIGYYPVDEMTPIKDYNKKDDCDIFASVEGDYITLKDDNFIILFPQDGHLARKAVKEPMAVKKVVIKILV